MLPQPQLAPVNAILTAFGVAYLQSLDRFICQRVFPWRTVPNKTGRYNVYTKDDTLRDEIGELVGTAESKEVGFSKYQRTYSTRRFGGRTFENDDLLMEWSGPMTVQQAISRHLLLKGMMRCEKMWHDGFFKTGVWGYDVTGGINPGSVGTTAGLPAGIDDKWDASGTDFIKNIMIAANYVESQTGFRPNTLVMALSVWTEMINQSFYRNLRAENVQWTTEQENKLANTLGMNILISRAVVAQGKVGAAMDQQNIDFFAGASNKSALMVYVEPNPTPITPTAGVTFTTRKSMGRALGEGLGFGVYRYVDQAKHAMVVDVRANWQHAVVAKDVGLFFHNIID